jgi:DNA-binding beta-propeller fold protein YncE|tara:strand:+ start:1844 stop:2923 length:1080 start_codon:yes stop_codon:yes gene_type:complete
MRKFVKLLPFFLALLVLVSSCSDDDDMIDLYPDELVKGAYVLNYGGFSNDAASITKYDYDADKLTSFYDQLQNNGAVMTSAPQWVYEYDEKIYVMGNNPDRILVYDPLFVGQDTITTSIVKPRNCIADGNYLYIACWGGDVWTDESLSYIARYNLTTKAVESTITLHGGPEGLEIANGKLYAALNYKNAVAVIDLKSEAVSYIETTAVCSYLVKDESDNLYVSLVGPWNDPSEGAGLGYINTTTDEITIYPLTTSSSYANIMALSKDRSKLYAIGASGYPIVGGVYIFNTSTKAFEDGALISDVTGILGISVNPENGDIYVLIDHGSSVNGEMIIYSANHELKASKTVGASPSMAIFLD